MIYRSGCGVMVLCDWVGFVGVGKIDSCSFIKFYTCSFRKLLLFGLWVFGSLVICWFAMGVW